MISRNEACTGDLNIKGQVLNTALELNILKAGIQYSVLFSIAAVHPPEMYTVKKKKNTKVGEYIKILLAFYYTSNQTSCTAQYVTPT